VEQQDRDHLAGLLGASILDARSLGGQRGVRHYRLELTEDRTAFAKVHRPVPGGAVSAGFPAEASGLRWLAEPGAVPVPAVLAADDFYLVTEWIEAGPPSQAAALAFGRELSALHQAGPSRFGAPWAGRIAGLPLPNEASDGDQWPGWYAARRVLPYVRIGRDAGFLSAADVALLESAAGKAAAVAGPPEPPARIHGDCWSGNVLWSGDRGWLIDPAAHGGHRETDLAMMALFEPPQLETILGAYDEVHPLADDWRERVALHQLHPLLVHAALFGGSYGAQAHAAARQYL
jgi:fructosamine-3-kinase